MNTYRIELRAFEGDKVLKVLDSHLSVEEAEEHLVAHASSGIDGLNEYVALVNEQTGADVDDLDEEVENE